MALRKDGEYLVVNALLPDGTTLRARRSISVTGSSPWLKAMMDLMCQRKGGKSPK